MAYTPIGASALTWGSMITRGNREPSDASTLNLSYQHLLWELNLPNDYIKDTNTNNKGGSGNFYTGLITSVPELSDLDKNSPNYNSRWKGPWYVTYNAKNLTTEEINKQGFTTTENDGSGLAYIGPSTLPNTFFADRIVLMQELDESASNINDKIQKNYNEFKQAYTYFENAYSYTLNAYSYVLNSYAYTIDYIGSSYDLLYNSTVYNITYLNDYNKNVGVNAYQLGTQYTGVGQWFDVKGKQKATTSYGEIFNDYNTNAAYGKFSHVEGTHNIAFTDYSHAEGVESVVGGVAAHAEGASEANGAYSHSGGFASIAHGHSSFVHGLASIAVNNVNTAIGYGIVSNGIIGQVSLGSYNLVYTDAIFQVGIGKDENHRANALTIANNGVSYFSNISYIKDPNYPDKPTSSIVTYLSYQQLEKEISNLGDDNLQKIKDLKTYVDNAYAYIIGTYTQSTDGKWSNTGVLGYLTNYNNTFYEYVYNQLTDPNGTVPTYMNDIYDKFKNVPGNVGFVYGVVAYKDTVEISYAHQVPGSAEYKKDMTWTYSYQNIIIPAATETAAGVLSSQDKIYLNSIVEGDKPLADISISGTWTFDPLTTTYSTSSQNSITIPYGYTATWTGTWKWKATDSQKIPEEYNDSNNAWGNKLPDNDTNSDSITKENIKSNTSWKQTIYAKKRGLVVDNGKVKLMTSENSSYDYKTASVSISFTYYRFVGYSETNNPTSEIILKNYIVENNKNTGITTSTNHSITTPKLNPSENQYVYYAYPATMKDISSILLDGKEDIFNAWKKLDDINITMPESNNSIKYKVYISTNPGAYRNQPVVFN